MAFTFGQYVYGLTDADYEEVRDFLPADVLQNLEFYDGDEGKFWIEIVPNGRLEEVLDEEGYLEYYSVFRYCGSAHGFSPVGNLG